MELRSPLRALPLLAIAACWIAVAGLPAKRLPLALPLASAQCPSDTVTYYGEVYEGEAFVWCLDRSCSMGWGDLFGQARAELVLAIGSLAPDQQFSIVAFSSSTVAFSAALVPADPANIAAAVAWLDTMTPDGVTCLAPAAVTALGMLQATAAIPALFVTGDGEPNCPGPAETLATVTAANVTGIPIHTVYLASDTGGITFMQQLAAMNGGTFLIPGSPAVPPFAGFPGVPFLRGDVNGDGLVTIADPIRILELGFGISCEPFCRDAADVTDDGIFEPLSDAITLLGALFVPGHPPVPAPTGACGSDPTPDGLSCFAQACP